VPDTVVGPAGGPDRADQVDRSDTMIQMLTPEGERPEPTGAASEYAAFVEDVTDDDLRGMYRDMVIVRRFDAEATALQRQGELGLWASLLGQEAAQVGSGRALRAQDFAYPTYREHGVAWCRDVPPKTLLGLYRGSSLGGWDPNEHNFALYTIVIGSQTLHATGYAMGLQRDHAVGTGEPDRDAAVIAYLGDGATSQGDVSEALVFSAVYNAPVVFFCQNNQWAISEPNTRQTRVPLYKRSSGFGIPGVRVDGNDVLATLAVTRAALERARSGGGPSFVEAYTYRMGAHTTSDDPSRYRIAAEVEEWKLKDPIARVKAYLARSGAADEAFFAEVDAEAAGIATELRTACRAMPDPTPESMFDQVYAAPHAVLDSEREEYLAYRAGFADETEGAHA
jgi:2-oxoisovalerate dehydrogenase E1 component alpha subunit